MIKENKAEFEICNIPKWHKQGYTGKGIKIANMESADSNLNIFDAKLHDPFCIGSNVRKDGHGQNVLSVMHEVAPQADLYTLPFGIKQKKGKLIGSFMEKSLPYIKNNNVAIVNASLGGHKNSKLNLAIEQAKEQGIVFVTSAGNSKNKGLTGFAKSKCWISVGAVGVDSKNKIFLKRYSSRGNELDTVAFSGLFILNSKGNIRHVEGTSFSSPMLCGMLALVQQFFLEKVGRTLYQNEIMKFIQDNVMDLGKKGHDELYGYGLFILPNPENIDLNKYLLRSDIMNQQDFINSVLEGAKDGYKRYKILPSLTIAQAILESAWGVHHIENNLFGMKASASWTGKVAYRNTKEWNGSRYVTVQAAFKVYNNFNESVVDHNELLGTLGRYSKVRQAKNYKQACIEVWKAGYATDPKYVQKLINIIEVNDLMKHDEEVTQEQRHWAEGHWKSLNEKGIIVHEQRFDDKITRGEMFALLDRATNLISNNKESE